MEGLPHLACPVANGPVDAMVSLRWAIRTLERRSHMAGSEEDENELTFDDPGDVKYGPAPSLLDEPALVVLIDGVEFLCASGDRRTATEAVAALRRLLAEGGGHRLHVVAATERPDIMISAGMGWRARITGQVSSPEAARMASGVKGSGAQGLLGEGDFVITVNAELIRFQAAAASADEVLKAIGFIHDRMREVQAQEQAEPQADELPFLRNAGVRRTIEPVRAKPPAQVPQQVARPAAQRRWGAELR
jgi:DNA segregation ATPase FtsK/SpoIIIE-like protein